MGFQVIAIMGIFIIPIVIGIFMSKKSKKVSMILFSIPFIFIVGVLAWWVYEVNDRFISSTDLSDEAIEPFHLMDEVDKETLETFGTFETEENQVFEHMYEYEDFSLATNEFDEIIYIEVRDGDYGTTQGIRIGDSIDLVEENYGTNTYTTKEVGIGVSKNYVDKDLGLRIKFFEKDGVITQITLHKK